MKMSIPTNQAEDFRKMVIAKMIEMEGGNGDAVEFHRNFPSDNYSQIRNSRGFVSASEGLSNTYELDICGDEDFDYEIVNILMSLRDA